MESVIDFKKRVNKIFEGEKEKFEKMDEMAYKDVEGRKDDFMVLVIMDILRENGMVTDGERGEYLAISKAIKNNEEFYNKFFELIKSYINLSYK